MVKLARMILTGSMLFAPAWAMGIAQQDPNAQQPAQQQLQQDRATTTGASQDVVGVIAEVRADSFSVRKDSDQSVVWFTITPELKQAASSDLVTGNHVRVTTMAGELGDRMMAKSIRAEAGGSVASSQLPQDRTARADNDLRIAQNATDPDSGELPTTASSLPVIGTLGLLALVGAAAVAFVRRF